MITLFIIKTSIKGVKYAFMLFFWFLGMFFTLCLNVITIPWLVLITLVCIIFRTKLPNVCNYSLCFYPSWEKPKHKTIISSIIAHEKRMKAVERNYKRRHPPIEPWESWFFR